MRKLMAIVSLLSISGVACGSGGESGGTQQAPSGVPLGATVGSLTPAQAAQFCKDVQGWAAESGMQGVSQELGCKLQGALAVADPRILSGTGAAAKDLPPTVPAGSEPAACQAAYGECKRKQAQGGTTITSLTDTCSADPSCNATVAEVKACLASVSTKLDGMTKSMPSCDGITSQSATDSLMTMLTFYSQMTSGDCAPVATKCASMNPLGSIKTPAQ